MAQIIYVFGLRHADRRASSNPLAERLRARLEREIRRLRIDCVAEQDPSAGGETTIAAEVARSQELPWWNIAPDRDALARIAWTQATSDAPDASPDHAPRSQELLLRPPWLKRIWAIPGDWTTLLLVCAADDVRPLAQELHEASCEVEVVEFDWSESRY